MTRRFNSTQEALAATISLLQHPALKDGSLQWMSDERAPIIVQVTEALTAAIDLADAPQKAMLERATKDFQLNTAQQLQERLREAQASLEENHMSRRLFLAGLATAGAAAATGGVAGMQPSEQPPTPQPQAWAPSAGFYLLLFEGAIPDAQQFLKSWTSEPAGIVTSQSTALVLAKQRFASYDDVHDLLVPVERRERPHKAPTWKCGIVMITKQRDIVRRKTFYECLAQRSQELEQQGNRHKGIIWHAVRRYPLTGDVELDTMIVEAVIWHESRGQERITKPGFGLMQLERGTFKEYHFGSGPKKQYPSRYHTKQQVLRVLSKYPKAEEHTCDILDPEQNIDVGVHLLAELFKEYYRKPSDLPLVLRGYNRGEGGILTALKLQRPNMEYAEKVLGTPLDHAD